MGTIIKNAGEFISGGNAALADGGGSALRRDLIEIAEAAIEAALPYERTRALVRLTEDGFAAGGTRFFWKDIRSVYVVGAGKASFLIAKALEDIFGDKIKSGIVSVKEGTSDRLRRIDIVESSHPIPDERSLEAARRIGGVLEKAGEGDLVFAAVTGGATALVNDPPDSVSLSDLRAVNALLLGSGAPIEEMNKVRRHLCRLKGGNLTARAQPAHVITLSLDTAGGKMPWPDMCLPDPATFGDAIDMLRRFGIWESAPPAVRFYLEARAEDGVNETVKDASGMNHTLCYLSSPQVAVDAAAAKAKELGYAPCVLSRAMEGEAKDVGTVLAGIANEAAGAGRPAGPPCAFISGGETTVTIGRGPAGLGGPNQETALGFALALREAAPTCAFISLDSDGTDGPCGIAGGLVDGNFAPEAARRGFSIQSALRSHDAGTLLKAMHAAVITGNTGTNVMNIRIALVKEAAKG